MEVLLARLQFTLCIGFHYIYPSVTIGLSWFIFIIMALWVRTGKEVYHTMARFWVKLFAIGFAVGVASGIVMEFQFGTNWATYSRFVGDIFGAPLAAEAVVAFFLESSFLGMLLFGWNRFSKKMHLFASLMVAVGSTMSAFWIIVANSWQQTPAGFKVVTTELGKRAELTNFFEAVFNPSTLPRFYHVITGSLLVSGFFLMSVAAFYLLRRQHEDFGRKTMTVGLIVTCVFAWLQLLFGHNQGIRVWQTQPIKLAAVEGLFDTEQGAPLLAIGLPSEEEGRTKYKIVLPKLLSFVLSGDWNTEVKGLNAFPKEDWPPVFLSFAFFHIMVGLGTLFIAFASLGILLLWRKKLFTSRWFLWLAAVFSPLPFIADHAGWFAAEIGRQPYIVYPTTLYHGPYTPGTFEGLRVADAVSSVVSTGELTFSLTMFAVIYSLLFVLWLVLLTRKIFHGPEQA